MAIRNGYPSYSDADWGWGSKSPVRASGRSQSGGPRAGTIRGGAVGSPRLARIAHTVGPSVMKAMIRISAPQSGHSSGNNVSAQRRALTTLAKHNADVARVRCSRKLDSDLLAARIGNR